MKTPFRNKPSQYSQMVNLNNERQSIGIMTPVHIQNIIKDRNLDYLQNLVQLAERMNVNPVWYEYETPQNKMKLLEIYQLSINYARNTQDIYKDVLHDLNDKGQKQRYRLNKLKSDILQHKQKTNKLKKNLRREKLKLEKEKAANYEKKLRKMKKELQRQLEQKQQQQQNSETSQLMTDRKKNESVHQPPPQPYPAGYPYPYPYPPPNYPPPPQYYYNYYPYQNQNQMPMQMPMQPPQNIMGAHFQGLINPRHSDEGKRQMIDQSFTKQVEVDQYIKQTANKSKNKRIQEDQLSLSSIIKESKKPESAVVKKSSSYAIKKSDPIRQSNVESEKGDTVEDLTKFPKSSIIKRGESSASAFSRKSSNSQMFDDSQLEMLKLNTQSKNDLQDFKKRPVQKQTSIANSISSIQKKKTIQNTPINKLENKQPQQSNNKYITASNSQQKKRDNIDQSDNKIQIKITKQKEKPKQQQIDYMNRLAQSNQGPQAGGLNFLGGFNGHLKLRQQTGNTLRNSITNSLDDDISKQGSRVKMVEQDQVEEYPQDFQEHTNQLDPNKIENTRVCIMTSSDTSSPQKNKQPTFVPLAKNYFILKDDFQALQQSNSNASSMLGSLKQFNFKFIGSQRRKTYQDRSSRGGVSDDGDFLELIDMPENSVIAKPSKLKQSTIRKSTIQQKINKSYEPKVPTQFVQQTPKQKKDVKFKQNLKVPDVDDNFQKIDQIPQLKSKSLPKNPLAKTEKQSVPNSAKSEQIKVDMTQSHMIDQINNPSIQLQIIPQSDQSYNTEKNTKIKILQLMDKKYEQRNSNLPRKFDKNIIKKQISSLVKNNKGQDPTYGQLADIFQQLCKKTMPEKIKLIKQRLKRMQQLKDMKDDSSRPSSKQNSNVTSKNFKKNEDSNISKKTGMLQRQDDDLTYSRSMVQNKLDSAVTNNFEHIQQALKKQQQPLSYANPSKELKSEKFETIKSQQMPSKLLSQLSTKPSSEQTKQSKFLRQKKQGSSNESVKLLNQLKQKSKFDRDDEIAAQIKKTISQATNAIKQQDDQDF